MDIYSPNKLLGQIGAIKTFVEQFPMDALDAPRFTPYSSVFEFLLDVLKQFGVDIETITNEVLNKVFEIQTDINGGVESVYKKIDDMDMDGVSEFLDKLETSVKSILLNILVGLSSCDANPFLRSEYLDKHKDSSNGTWGYYPSTYGITLNRRQIDLFDSLSISPFSREGKFFYNAEAKTKYYKKESEEVEIFHDESWTAYACDSFSRIFVQFCGYHEEYVDGSLYVNDEFMFATEHPLPNDLKIRIEYTDPLHDESEISPSNTLTQEVEIRAGEKYSDIVMISPYFANNTKQFIRSIKLGVGDEFVDAGMQNGDTWCYLDKPSSETVINFWESKSNFSFNNVRFGSISDCPTEERSGGYTEVKTIYKYVEFDGAGQDCYLVNYLPDEASESDPEYIQYYEGLDENSANRTYDMNTFLWYIFNHECKPNDTQVEINKNMWDSRVTARKNGVARNNIELWNNWYNSKSDAYYDPHERPENEGPSSLHIDGATYTTVFQLYPILQFLTTDKDNINVSFASQTYYKPGLKENEYDTDKTFVRENLRMNSTIFKFNKDYLNNITIFNPKTILFNMFNGLLNGALSAAMGININPYRMEVETKLSTAIKKYIEAEDTEIEDCYFEFSNDEFNEMLQRTILNRYKAVRNSNDNSDSVQYNVDDYMKKLDSVNFSASAAGQTESITKILTDVSSEGYMEGFKDTQLSLNVNKGFFERILWALTMPIVESIFTPQVMLLFYINFYILGLTSTDDLFGNDNEKLINFVFNKLFNIVKSIVRFIKDSIAKILLDLFFKIGLISFIEYIILLFKERINDWLRILANALAWLRLLKFNRRKPGPEEIDDVDYADIETVQNKPESKSSC